MRTEKKGSILILGGTGTFGRLAVGDLLMRSSHSVAVATRRGIADDKWPAGSEGRLTSHRVDARDRDALRALIEELDPKVILHAAGPYFAIGSVPLKVAIETRTPYVDLCPRSFRYFELEKEFGDAAGEANIPVLVGTSTVGGITGLLTRRASQQMETVERVETVLSVHNFGWGGGLVSDYLRKAAIPTVHGKLGERSRVYEFPDGSRRKVALGDTLEYVPTDGLCPDTTHWFGLNARIPNWSIRVGEWFARRKIPVWLAAGPSGWLAGKFGGRGTDGIMIHDAVGTKGGKPGTLRTIVIRPFGNIRNPAVLSAISARVIADGENLGKGFVHPASWMDPDRIVPELTDRANLVETTWIEEAS